MAKPFDYSKWDNIELSDDESDCHPNIEKESWFRMKHRSRVEREENEEKDKKKIHKEMKRDKLRVDELAARLEKMEAPAPGEEEDLEDPDGMRAEIGELSAANLARQKKLDDYERNKKWNVDNLSTVVDDKSQVNQDAAKASFDESGYALPKEKKEVQGKT
jgi:cell division cycle protein 37